MKAAEEHLIAEHMQWPAPSSREVGLFTDLTLYAEALESAHESGAVTVSSLQRGLGQRLQKMRLVPRQSRRTVERLMRELRYFGWLEPLREAGETLSTAPHIITSEGDRALTLSRQDARAFRRLLTIKMQEVYVIPGWFIARLWQINPQGQGEVILPDPPADWRPPSRSWDDNSWDATLHTKTLAAAHRIKVVNPGAFPVSDEDWLSAVRQAWERLSALKPRSRRKEGVVSYSSRARLTLAMREAAVKLLFDRVPYGSNRPDFPGERPPIYLRTFMGWCPRLETLELIFYTDWHPQVEGRLLFPTSVFRSSAPAEKFEQLSEVQHPNGDSLWLHQPKWENIRSLFLDTLISVHQRHTMRSGTLYVSLLDVRDEVCRQLRLSSFSFDFFLERTMRELPAADFHWSVAVETDIREEQSSGSGQLRRPVYLDGVPHTLIALARLPQNEERSPL
ncbi:MAG: hypothetical protein Kow0063_41750 [Anaerolineae bacterium]